jgi:hypothetical protein
MLRPQNFIVPKANNFQLHTWKQRNLFPAGFIDYFGVPYLGGPSAVDAGGNAGNHPFTGSA